MPSLPKLDIKTNINHSPHVLILGAGASLASFPKGDATEKRLLLMNNLIDLVALRPLIEGAGLSGDIENFEAFYDDLVTTDRNPQLVNQIEAHIREYFAGMSLPDEATIYDYLILTLRKKDLIATFNWDPFLAHAYRRNMRITEPPHIAFLHGNVAIGVCTEHRRVGFSHQSCGICGAKLSPSKLLYPVKHKDYNSDLFIKSEWDILRSHLEDAYYVTIFGYSAPTTDVEAKQLMLDVWKKNPTLPLTEVNIIDIKSEEKLEKTWEDFLYTHHYGIYDDIRNTILFRHPRRTCDAFAMATLQCAPWEDNPIPLIEDLAALQAWVAPLVAEEQRERFSGAPCGKIAIDP